MPPAASAPELLTLHAVRLAGVAESGAVAARFGLDAELASEQLLDFQALGWVTRAEFAGTGGWTLTEAGRRENERQLAAELSASGAAAPITRIHEAFLPLNARHQDAMTRWQLRPIPGDPLAVNDHADHRWDDRVLDSLHSLGGHLAAMTAVLSRFAGYDRRYATAVSRAERGEQSWVDGVGIDSCHRVWFELHEDLLATLGIERGSG